MKLEINGVVIDTGDQPVTFLDSPNINTAKIKMEDVLEIAKEFDDLKENKSGAINSILQKLLPVVIGTVGVGKYTSLIPALSQIYEAVKDIKANKKTQAKVNNLILPVTYDSVESEVKVETPNDLAGVDLSPLRTNRVHAGNLVNAPINIVITGKRKKDLSWREPVGFEKGKHGFFVVGFKGKKVIYRSETHASHGRTTSFLSEDKPDNSGASEVMVVWSQFEGKGDQVYGRSKLTEVK